MTLIVDFSHVHRPTTGIERVSLDLFSPEALHGIIAENVRASSALGMVWAQWVRLPLRAIFKRKAAFLCPGFPPSLPLALLGGGRVLPYIHDLFLIERRQDLNATAKYYMRPSFAFAVRHSRAFLVNSAYTRAQLQKYCRKDAQIQMLRPSVSDVFGLRNGLRAPKTADEPLRLVTVGTVEPRKNLRFAADLRRKLETKLSRSVEFHIVGREGWGEDAAWLRHQQGVVLHGYCSADKAREILRSADIFISTSKEEGLGLPLLEVQHGGFFVAASDIPVYREVLAESGCLLPLNDVEDSAQKLATRLSTPDWFEQESRKAVANVARWNALSSEDRQAFFAWLRNREKQERFPDER